MSTCTTDLTKVVFDTHANRHPRQARCPAPKDNLQLESDTMWLTWEDIPVAHKLDHTPGLVPDDWTVPSNHLLGLQISASSPHMSLFLKNVCQIQNIVGLSDMPTCDKQRRI